MPITETETETETEKKYSSYLNMIAGMGCNIENITHRYHQITQEIQQFDQNTLSKLMAKLNAIFAQLNQRLLQLENQRQNLKNLLEKLLLSVMTEKNITDITQTKQANDALIATDLIKIKKNLADLDKKMTYFCDLNNDQQTRYLHKCGILFDKIDDIQTKKMDLLVHFFKQQGLESVTHAVLKNIFQQPEIQSVYFAATAPKQTQSLTAKLKGWFQ